MEVHIHVTVLMEVHIHENYIPVLFLGTFKTIVHNYKEIFLERQSLA